MKFDFKIGKVYVNAINETVEVENIYKTGLVHFISVESGHNLSYCTNLEGLYENNHHHGLNIVSSIDGDEEAEPIRGELPLDYKVTEEVEVKIKPCLFRALKKISYYMDELDPQDKIAVVAFLTTRLKIQGEYQK